MRTGEGAAQPCVGTPEYPDVLCVSTHEYPRVLQTKKARFWRTLVEMFPNVIDYLCAPTAHATRL